MTTYDAVLRFVDPAADALLAHRPGPRKALFLDRDGVINVDRGYVHTPENTEWMPGIFELVRAARLAGYLPIVVTNQAGIARGYYSELEFLAYTAWVHEQFRLHEAPLLATYFCPHHPQGRRGPYRRACECRKPEPGMLLQAIRDWAVDPAASMLLGDKDSDLDAARSAGVIDARMIGDGRIPTWPIGVG